MSFGTRGWVGGLWDLEPDISVTTLRANTNDIIELRNNNRNSGSRVLL